MAAEVVGGAFLSSFINVLFERLASPKVVNFICGKKLDKRLLTRLETTLYAVRAVLNDAEQKQIKDPAVKKWLDDLRDAVYEADDLLDELSTKAVTQKEVSNLFSYLNLRDRDMGNKIEDIVVRLEGIERHKDILGLKNIGGVKSLQRPQSTSLVEVSEVYGRDRDREAIIDLLLSDECSDSDIAVIPIVGMGGIGKTTLAQMVYNDDNVRQKFDHFAWVCVSEEFDVVRITKIIIQAITSRVCDKNDLNLLQVELKEQLKGKKIFVVLDDIWNESYTEWDLLMTPFHQGSKRIKILVTTRSEKVASIVKTIPSYSLGYLSDDHCWLVCAKQASPSKDCNLDSYLEMNRMNIINKCKGLPLASKLLGGLLRSKLDVKFWEIILKNDIWDLFEYEAKIIPALAVSYHYLPPCLKRCFVHCSLFPKDYIFDGNELILLWMAEDLLQPMDRQMILEDVGFVYLDELVSRSFFQRSNLFAEGRFVMHDLIHDLATYYAGEIYSISEVGEERNISTKTRHTSYNMFSGSNVIKIRDIEALSGAKSLRTFLPLIRWTDEITLENPPHILQQLLSYKCLRVFSLCGFETLEFMYDSIGELIHLRYLDLSGTRIRSLPCSLCQLHNLQTLRLTNCINLTMLPSDMQDLVNLRYLDVRGTPLQNMPRGLSELKNLQCLSHFIVGKDHGARIGEMGDLSNLGGYLCIEKLQYVSNAVEASQARMTDKKYIEILELCWGEDDMNDSQMEREILDKLKPHKNLKSLYILGYRGTKFSDWLGLLNMTEIKLFHCRNCFSLPPLGQLPSLKKLEICGWDSLVTIDDAFYKSRNSSLATAFPSLEHLEFRDLRAWEEWDSFERDAFPLLQMLILDGCPRLVRDLPKSLPALETLNVSNCQQLASSIPRAPLLRTLNIKHCRKVEFPKQKSFEFLERFTAIDSCDSFSFFAMDTCPNLQLLKFFDNRNFTSLSVSESPPHNLRWLDINYCPNFAHFSIGGLPAPNMANLVPNLKSFPGHVNNLLTKLQHLSILGCPRIGWHGEQGLPPNLTLLAIDHCLFSKYHKQWSLLCLTSLTINGEYDGSVHCFPEHFLLPASLTSLELYSFPNLEMLDCNGFLHLTSLQKLEISECPKLEKMEGERLPPSLTELGIMGCPLLEVKCRTKKAEIWPKISHIPTIHYWWVASKWLLSL